jgi:hypothetical protein
MINRDLCTEAVALPASVILPIVAMISGCSSSLQRSRLCESVDQGGLHRLMVGLSAILMGLFILTLAKV